MKVVDNYWKYFFDYSLEVYIFGIMLVHKHFDVSEDEVIMEFTDVDARVQTTKPIKKNELLGSSIETSWLLQDGPPNKMLACLGNCWMNAAGNHVS